MLELDCVCKRFAGIPAVDSVSFRAARGEVTGYLGPNGSGKSTTMKIITGLLEPTSGVVRFDGVPTTADASAFKRRLGYVPEEPHLYTHLTGYEYLEMVAQLRELPERGTRERIEEFLRLLGLSGDRHAAISGYSKGMRQKVLLAAALLHNPDLILLHEPFSGLDVSTSLMLRALIETLARRGKVVLFSSHELEIVERVCSRVIILHRGRVVADDTIAALREWQAAPSLEAVFTQLAAEVETTPAAQAIADLVAGA
ncbi:MAG: ABC transporter ATP-binding protein [Bryobacteraceae bacterium]|nr:ABC transporter ATP-binding protein [Bryobacteraceae bacterium]